jgi:hypothetical protein
LNLFFRNPSEKLRRAPYEDSTGNFNAHIKRCDPKNKGNIADFATGSTYTAAGFRLKLALWTARRKRPYTIVADPELVDIFKMLYNKVDIPCERTVSRDVQDIYRVSKSYVREVLSEHVGKIHFAVDGWASPNRISILGISCIRYTNRKIEEFSLDFVKYVCACILFFSSVLKSLS